MANIIEEIKENVGKGEDAIKEVVEKAEGVVGKIEDKKLDKKVAPQAHTQRAREPLRDPETFPAEMSTRGKKISLDTGKKVEKIKEDNQDELAQKAEEESLKTEKPGKSIEEKKKELLEKVKKLSGKVDITKTDELKEQVKLKKRADMLIPLEEYVKAGIYLGTKVVTPDMKPFMYRRRADGLAIFNTDLIDEKLKEGIEFLSKFEAKDIILACKRQAGWKAAQMFSQLTGIRVFKRKYPAGVLTNTTLPDFFENELTIVADSWLDKNALHDTVNVRKKVLMICDTNNFAKGADKVIIGNNKSPKSLGVIFYLLARGYCKAKNIEADIPDLDWWVSEKEE